MQNLGEKKSCQENDIPVKLIKLNKEFVSHLYIATLITHHSVIFSHPSWSGM